MGLPRYYQSGECLGMPDESRLDTMVLLEIIYAQ